VTISNSFGAAPLRVGEVGVAVAGPGATLVPGTTHVLTFGGRRGICRLPRGGRQRRLHIAASWPRAADLITAWDDISALPQAP